MPVLPLVASTIVLRPGSIRPSRSAASIIATPIRSFTEPPGLSIPSLANRRAPSGSRRASSTIGVRPTCAAMLIGMSPIEGKSLERFRVGIDAPALAHPGALVEPQRVRVVGGDAEAHAGEAGGAR